MEGVVVALAKKVHTPDARPLQSQLCGTRNLIRGGIKKSETSFSRSSTHHRYTTRGSAYKSSSRCGIWFEPNIRGRAQPRPLDERTVGEHSDRMKRLHPSVRKRNLLLKPPKPPGVDQIQRSDSSAPSEPVGRLARPEDRWSIVVL